jgi:general secretion pathway protein I
MRAPRDTLGRPNLPQLHREAVARGDSPCGAGMGHRSRRLQAVENVGGWSSQFSGPASQEPTDGLLRHPRREAGFTLLEVLVAFAVLALTMGVLIEVFSQAIGNTLQSGAYSRAAALAEARLGAVGTDIPLQPGTSNGQPEDGMAWQVVIAPYDLGESGWQAPLQPYLVTATVGWGASGHTREVTLTTLRLGEPAP